MKKTKCIAAFISAIAMTVSAASVTAFAAESENTAPAKSSYSYFAGRQRSIGRNEIFALAAEIEDDDERKAFLIANGISETEYSEEIAASYSYTVGRQRGASYRSDNSEQTEAQSGYSYAAGRQRGSSYHH